MENPLELPAPPNAINRVEALALDLAYGVVYCGWDPVFGSESGSNSIFHIQINPNVTIKFVDYYRNKWSEPPSVYLMQSFGYFDILSKVNFQTNYLLTSKAFALLEHPPTAPSVFISYKRECSSAFALLVESKLKLRDSGISVFVDKLIKPGDDWSENIQTKIKESRYFICLLAPDTYTESEWVRKELDWAYEAGCKIISVFHDSAALNERYPVWLGKKQIIKVDFETAKHYESALDEILVGLGYSTY